jgi:hypothetical protein
MAEGSVLAQGRLRRCIKAGTRTVASRWRIHRAALLGFAAGLVFKAAGLFPVTPEPPDVVYHSLYTGAEWASYAVVVAVIFSIATVIRNLIFVRKA